MNRSYRSDPIDYSGVIVNELFVEERNDKSSTYSFSIIEDVISNISGGAICIASDTISERLSNVVKTLKEGGVNRIYIITGSDVNPSAIYGRSLVRRLKKDIHQSGSVLIHVRANGDYSAWLASSAEFEDTVAADMDNSNRLYQTFCAIFWNLCDKEACMSDKWAESQESPYSFISVDNGLSMPNDDYLSEYIDDLIETDDAFVSIEPGNLSLYCDNPNNLSEIVYKNPKFKGKGVEVSFTRPTIYMSCGDTSGFDQICGGEKGLLISSSIVKGGINWALVMDKRSMGEYNSMVDRSWRYNDSVKLKDISECNVRELKKLDEAYHIDPMKVVPLVEHTCSTVDVYLDDKTAFEEYIASNPVKRYDAISVVYEVTFHPPNIPSNAKPHKSIEEWNKSMESWKKTLENIKTRCNRAINVLPNDSNAVAIGLKNKRDQLVDRANELISLSVKIPSMSKNSREDLDNQRKRLDEESQALQYRCELENYKDKDKKKRIAEIEKITEKIEVAEKERAVLDKTIGIRETELQEKDRDLQELNKEFIEVESDYQIANKELMDAKEEYDRAEKELREANKEYSAKVKDEEEVKKASKRKREGIIQRLIAPMLEKYRNNKKVAEERKKEKEEVFKEKRKDRETIEAKKNSTISSKNNIQRDIEKKKGDIQIKESSIKGWQQDIDEINKKPEPTELPTDELKKILGIDDNKIVEIKYPDIELPQFEGAMLHANGEELFISVPDNLEDDVFRDDILKSDSLRLNAKLCVR